jgi:hypothetical protein
MKSSATVMRAEISREPKQPRRFEKKKNIRPVAKDWMPR